MLKYLNDFILPKEKHTLADYASVQIAIPAMEAELRTAMRSRWNDNLCTFFFDINRIPMWSWFYVYMFEFVCVPWC